MSVNRATKLNKKTQRMLTRKQLCSHNCGLYVISVEGHWDQIYVTRTVLHRSVLRKTTKGDTNFDID